MKKTTLLEAKYASRAKAIVQNLASKYNFDDENGDAVFQCGEDIVEFIYAIVEEGMSYAPIDAIDPTLGKAYREYKDSISSTLSESAEPVEGLEFVPNGRGGTAVKSITTKLKSHKTSNKLSDVEKVPGVVAPSKVDLKRAKAVYNYLKDHNKLDDVADEFNTNPAPDIRFNGVGDATIQPDDGGASYKVPERKLAQYD